MAMKKKVTKDEYAKLSDAFKAEYVEDGDGYRLDVTGEEDTGALKRSKDREAQLRKDAEQKLAEAQAELDRIQGDDARKNGDIATLEKSWQGKLDKQASESNEKLEKLTGHVTKSLVDNVALSVASKISNAPALLLPHIRARLQANFEGDVPTTRVLDKDGKPSAMTVEELSAEFVANKDFSAIIVASKASGGAGKSNQSGGAANNSGNSGQQPAADLSKMSPQALAAHVKESKAAQEN